MSKSSLHVVFSLAFFSLVLISCSPHTKTLGEGLYLSLTSDPKTFNPIIVKESSSSVITGHLFEGLTRTDAISKKVEPALAEHWSSNRSKTVWDFYLRKGLLWSDGKELTADDVVFTFKELIYNPAVSTSSRFIFTIAGKAIQVKKIGKYQVRFILPKPFFPFLRSLSHEIMPKHKLKKFVDEGSYNSAWGINTNPKEIVGSGPYLIESYRPNEVIILRANDKYWRKDRSGKSLPYIKKIFYYIVKDSNAARILFQDGTTDALGIEAKDWPLLKREENEKTYRMLDLGPGPSSLFLVFNQNPGKDPKSGKRYLDPVKYSVFRNVHFRRAMAYAIDKKTIIQNLYFNLASAQKTGIWEESPYHNPTVPTYDFNLEKARKELELAGLKDKDDDGYRKGPDGKRFEFTLLVRNETTLYIRKANLFVADLKKIGIKVNIKPILFNNLVQKLNSTFDWEATFIGLTGGLEPHFGRNVWHSSGVLHMWYPRQTSPATSWEKEIDLIFDKAATVTTIEARKRLYSRFQVIVATQLPLIYTVKSHVLYGVKNKFIGLKPSAYGGLFHNLEELKIRE